MKSLRTVCLTALTLFFYGLSIFLQQGELIFPLPANDFILVIIFLYLFFIEKNARKDSWVIFIYVLFQLIANPFNYELVCSNETLEILTKGYLFEILQLITQLIFGTIILLTFLKHKSNKLNPLIILSALTLVASLFFTEITFNFLQLASFLSLFAFYSMLNKSLEETKRIYLPQAFWLLCIVLKLTLIITLYFLD